MLPRQQTRVLVLNNATVQLLSDMEHSKQHVCPHLSMAAFLLECVFEMLTVGYRALNDFSLNSL